MMKKNVFKTIILGLMMMCSVATASAQDILGKWEIPAELIGNVLPNQKLSFTFQKEGKMRFDFTGTFIQEIEAGKKLSIKMKMKVPGTYTVAGGKFSCTLSKEGTELDLGDAKLEGVKLEGEEKTKAEAELRTLCEQMKEEMMKSFDVSQMNCSDVPYSVSDAGLTIEGQTLKKVVSAPKPNKEKKEKK